jgi:prepilin-type N-terminal cleavage/methylation domain-containing protein
MDRNKAFTMVELLVAITIIALMIVPLVGIVATQLKRDQYAADRGLALAAARNAMETALDPGLPAAAVRDDSTLVTLNGQGWVVVVDPIDGLGEGEPPIGTDPLEVRVRVYRPGSAQVLAALTALKGP